MLQTSLPGYDPKESLASVHLPHPEVLWAQRSSQFDETKNLVYLTVNLPDIRELSLECALGPTKIAFKAECPTGSYYFEIEFFSEIIPEKSTRTLTAWSLFMVLFKKVRAEYWPRLTAEKDRHAHIRTDFDKWLGEDEQGGSESRDGEGLGVQHLFVFPKFSPSKISVRRRD
ncbi:HSP20-like chaperone [Mycena sp. CBHHK59/15]|nr:HSP20-like chaperone [Mycena sp. CBHHK59/15]